MFGSTQSTQSTPSFTRARRIAIASAVSAGLLAPLALHAAETTAAAAPGRPAGWRYTSDVVGTRSAPTDGDHGTQARGIADSGAVLATRLGGAPYLGQPSRARELAPTHALSVAPVYVPVLTPGARAYGAICEGAVLRWKGARIEQFSVNPKPYYGLTMGGANDRADIAACTSDIKTGQPVFGNVDRGTMKQLSWPQGSGNCQSAALSRTGLGVFTQSAPYFKDLSLFPRAVIATPAGASYLRAPASVGSSADAISPNGSLIVGRLYKDGAPTSVVWLSKRRAPVVLRGAGGMTPQLVTDKGVVVGVEKGRVVLWQNGAKADLTAVSKLPRGWVLTSVAGINAKGQMAVTATVRDTREVVAMRLTPATRR